MFMYNIYDSTDCVRYRFKVAGTCGFLIVFPLATEMIEEVFLRSIVFFVCYAALLAEHS